jgi:hypothetical protein
MKGVLTTRFREHSPGLGIPGANALGPHNSWEFRLSHIFVLARLARF